jgi:3-hydroxyacyl-[acyl-carrier-protein] dehydratase
LITDLTIDAGHQAYAGHFPGFPILPGAVLLDEVLHEIARERGLDLLHWQVSSVKFLETVAPGEALTLEHTALSDASIRFAVRKAGGPVASGVLSAVAQPVDSDGA